MLPRLALLLLAFFCSHDALATQDCSHAIFLRSLDQRLTAIRETSDRNIRRTLTYKAWAEARIAYSILVVYMRTLRYDRDFRNNIQLEHEKALIALGEQDALVRSLWQQLDEAKQAFSENRALPLTHPLHTVTPKELDARISWSSQVLMEAKAKLASFESRVAATRYTETGRRVKAEQQAYDAMMHDLWKILREITWPTSRWTFRTMVTLDVLRLRYANANYLIKIVFPTVIGVSTTTAIFGDWLHLKIVLEALQRLLGNG